MKIKFKKLLYTGSALVALFAVWTVMIRTVDVQSVGVNGTDIGFATLNVWFHELTRVNMLLYIITDWLGLVPIFCCGLLGMVGLIQLIKRKNLLKVDFDIIVLGIYYVIVIIGYLVFEMIPINYRPVLIDGMMEVSYPSSTTLLVLSVMLTVFFQVNRRVKNDTLKKFLCFAIVLFSVFMVIGRLISGVHWLTDIIGSIVLSSGLYCIYKAIAMLNSKV